MENSKLYIQQQDQEKQKLRKPASRASVVFKNGTAAWNVDQLNNKTTWSDLYGHK